MNADLLRWVLLGGVALLVLSLVPMFLFIGRLVVKVIGVLVVLGLIALLWSQRTTLAVCYESYESDRCDAQCKVFGIQVALPSDLPKDLPVCR